MPVCPSMENVPVNLIDLDGDPAVAQRRVGGIHRRMLEGVAAQVDQP